MSNYFMTEQAKGNKPFKCPICNKMLIVTLVGSTYELILSCSRCKSLVAVTSNVELPILVEHMRELQRRRQVGKIKEQYSHVA